MPELPLHALRPLVLDAAAALLQLAVAPYPSVRAQAARAEARLLGVSTHLAAAVFPSIVAAAAVMHSSALPPERPATAGRHASGFRIPDSLEAAAASLAEQNERLLECVQADDPGVPEPAGGDLKDGICDGASKHAVLGGLGLMETCRGPITGLCVTAPASFVAVILSALVMQSFAGAVQVRARSRDITVPSLRLRIGLRGAALSRPSVRQSTNFQTTRRKSPPQCMATSLPSGYAVLRRRTLSCIRCPRSCGA